MNSSNVAVRQVTQHAAEEFEVRLKSEADQLHRDLRHRARALFATLKGHPGIRTEEKLAELLIKVTGDYETGKFLMEQLGADRYLEYERALTLSHMRQQLLSHIEQPTMPDKMAADTAVLAYHNLLRIQGWIGNICLVVERDLFGQEPLNELHGPQVGEKLANDLRQLENQMFPLLDRAHRMMMRSLTYLDGRLKNGKLGGVTVERAEQVNIASAVEN
jgi:hypothetical protein